MLKRSSFAKKAETQEKSILGENSCEREVHWQRRQIFKRSAFPNQETRKRKPNKETEIRIFNSVKCNEYEGRSNLIIDIG
jgi:hypothetical protein